MHANALFHSAMVTQSFLGSYGRVGERLMAWPPASPDPNYMENLWFIIKQDIYVDKRQLMS